MATKFTRCYGCGAPTMFKTSGPEGEDVSVCISCRRYWTSETAAPIDIPAHVTISVEWPE